MYGNVIGWLIGTILGIVASVLMWVLLWQLPGVTSPSNFIKDPANLAKIQIPEQTFVRMDSDLDEKKAGELYREAVAEYMKNPTLYKPGGKIEISIVSGLPAFRKILEASHCSKADIFRSHPAEIISFQPTAPALEAMNDLYMKMMNISQHYLVSKQYDDSRRYAEALFTMGARMADERLTYRQFHTGMAMMATSALMLRAMPDNAAQAAVVRDWYEKFNAYGKLVEKRQSVLRHIDEKIVKEHAGDQFYFARNKDMDKMWRVETTLQLGFLKDRAPKKADRVAAPIVLKRMMQESDPVIQFAAQTAINATKRDINQMGGL